MPEGPHLIFLKEQVAQFVGQSIMKAAGNAPHIPLNRLPDQQLTYIKTFGKEILFCFPHFVIRIHFMLFGKYAINGKLNRELGLGLAFEIGEINFYAGDYRLITTPLSQVYDWSTDVLHPSFDQNKALEKLICQPTKLICEALLDQRILAGVGNGIKNEILFRRSIHPQSLVGNIPETELKALLRASVTASTEYLGWLHEGTENKHWQVYQQKYCPRHHTPLRREKIGKSRRSCYYCEICQELYLPDNI